MPIIKKGTLYPKNNIKNVQKKWGFDCIQFDLSNFLKLTGTIPDYLKYSVDCIQFDLSKIFEWIQFGLSNL